MKKWAVILCVVLSLFSCQAQSPEQAPLTYDKAFKQARGTSVNFYMWGGSATINAWVDGYVTHSLKEKFDITLNRVPMDASVFVNKLLTEKQAGKKKGAIDLMWINGENFKNAREADLLYGPVADKLPSVTQYIDAKTFAFDFGFPVENYEVPYGKAQFVFVYDAAKIPTPPNSFASLKTWIMENPGKFTYPPAPDFTGSAFIRQVFYATTGGHEQYMNGFDEQLYVEKSKDFWAYLKEIKPYLWQKAEAYPKDIAALDLLFERGEVSLNMSYHQANASSKITEGKYPDTVRTFVMSGGSIYNTHFTAIAFNAPNIAGAMVTADFLASPAAQLSKNTPKNWGDFTVLDMAKLDDTSKKAFAELDLGVATLPLDVLNQHGVPEIPSAYLSRLEADWLRIILGKNSPSPMKPYYKLLPALLPFVLFFAGGIVLTVLQSLGMMNPLVHTTSMWTAYKIVLTHSHFLVSILFSFYVALVSSTIATVLGTLLAYTIWKLPLGLQSKTVVYKIPLVLPHIAVAFITMIFLSRSGVFSSLCYHLGITATMEAFPNLIFSRYGVGEIIAYSIKETSFVALMAVSVLMKFDKRYLQTARQLGAGEIRIFFSVVLPHLKETLTTTFLILFIYSFGAFEIPYILGNSSPGMLSLQVYDYYFKHDLSQRPVAMALLVILFLVSSLLAYLYFKISNKLDKGGK